MCAVGPHALLYTSGRLSIAVCDEVVGVSAGYDAIRLEVQVCGSARNGGCHDGGAVLARTTTMLCMTGI